MRPPCTCLDKSQVKKQDKDVDFMDMPSSGVIVRVKLRRSAGSGKWVAIVEGRSSSVKSYGQHAISESSEDRQ
jgi:hypothetical protein